MSWNRNSDRVRRGPQNVDPKRLDWKRFLGNAPAQDFDDYKFRNWRWFWDFGNGILTDLMVHWLDVAHWILNVDHPDKAVTVGQFNTARDVWQTPDTIQTLLHYGNNLQMHFEGTFCNARRGAMIEFMGTRRLGLHRPRPLRVDSGAKISEEQAGGTDDPGPGPRGRISTRPPTANCCT